MKDFINEEPTKRHKHRTVLHDVRRKEDKKLYEKQILKAKRLGIRPPISPVQKRLGARRIA